MTGILKDWSVTAASNTTAATGIAVSQGTLFGADHGAARAIMAAIKAFANQITGAKTSGGSANAYTFTSDTAGTISTAYAAGMAFVFKANHSNTGASTLNVDGVGAKSIKKGGAQAALVANDIASGGVYFAAYEASGDCFLLLNPESGQITAQALDATLTALAAVSWASGTEALTLTAADTITKVALAHGTYTPTATSVSNVAASTPGVASYLRVGSSVTVSGEVQIDPTTTGDFLLGLSLPIASNFTASTDCSGTASAGSAAGYGIVNGDNTNDRAQVAGNATVDTTNRSWRYTYTYRVL